MATRISVPVSEKGSHDVKQLTDSTADDHIPIASIKAAIIKNLNRGRSGSSSSKIKGGKSEICIDTVTNKEHTAIESSMKDSSGGNSVLKIIKSGVRLRNFKTEEGVKPNGGEQNDEGHFTPRKLKKGADGDMVLMYLSSAEPSLSRLRPRKEGPTFCMVNLDENDNERIVGKRVKVYWSGSRRWFTGLIKSFDDKKRIHSIHYEDGDREELDLRKERFELEIMPTEGFNVRTETPSGKRKREASDGVKLGVDLLDEESGQVGDADKMTRSSKPMTLKSLKKVGKNKSSKSHAKDTENDGSITKLVAEILPEELDQVISDELPDAVPGEKEHVQVKNMGSYGSDTENTVLDDDIEFAKLAKRHKSSKEEVMRGANNMRRNKSGSRNTSSVRKKVDAAVQVDLLHDDLKMKSVSNNVPIEEGVKVSHQKELCKTEVLALEKTRQRDGEELSEIQNTQPNLNTENNKNGLVNIQVSSNSDDQVEMPVEMENIVASEDKMICSIDVTPNVEVACNEEIAKGVNRKIAAEGPQDVDAVNSDHEKDSVLVEETDWSSKVSIDLQPATVNYADEENPKILQEKLKTKNDEIPEGLSNEEVVNLTTQKVDEAEKTNINDDAES